MKIPPAILLLMLAVWAAGDHARGADGPGKKVIYYGWNTRDSAYVRDKWREMERMPFDGVGIAIAIDRNGRTSGNGSTGNLLGWQVFGKTAFQLSDFQAAVADLQTPQWVHFTNNFLPLSIATRDQDEGLTWFDDVRWATIEGNWRVLVTIARDGGCRGLLLDPEHYDYACELFNYNEHRAQRVDRSYADYCAMARARGQQLGAATKDIFPNLTVGLLYGYGLALSDLRNGKTLQNGRYALLPAFLDGLLEASDPQAHFVDLWEQGHHNRTLAQFQSARTAIESGSAASLTQNPAVYRARMTPGLSLRIDYELPRVRWSFLYPNRNFYSPVVFRRALGAALSVTNEYVWIYSENGPRFFPVANIHGAYLTAIRAARVAPPQGASASLPLTLGLGGMLALCASVPLLRSRRRDQSGGRCLRILMVTGIFPPDRGGPASSCPKMACALTELGHSVSVICLSDELAHDDSGFRFRVQRISRRIFWPVRVLRTTLAIWQAARDHDLVYVNGLGAESALAALLAGRPAVHKVVGDYAWERAVGRSWFGGTLDEYQTARKSVVLRVIDLVRTVPLKLAKAIIVPSRYLQRIVCGWGLSQEKVRVVHNAVPANASTERGLLLPEWKGRTIMTVCRLVPWKGVDAVIRLLPELPGTRFVIAGDGHERGHLETLAQTTGVAERVLFLGDVPHGSVHQYLVQADAFVLNSTYEGLPHVVLEAMAARVPVIATDAGGTGEVVEQMVTGLLVRPGDSAGLKSAIEQLWADPALGARLVAEAGVRAVAHFDFGAMVAATEAVLRGALPGAAERSNQFLEPAR